MLTRYDWRSDEEYNRFIEAYLKTGCIPIDSDWAKAHYFWRLLDWTQKAAATAHVRYCNGAYVKLPQNYLQDREWLRRERPAARDWRPPPPPPSAPHDPRIGMSEQEQEELDEFIAERIAQQKAAGI